MLSSRARLTLPRFPGRARGTQDHSEPGVGACPGVRPHSLRGGCWPAAVSF